MWATKIFDGTVPGDGAEGAESGIRSWFRGIVVRGVVRDYMESLEGIGRRRWAGGELTLTSQVGSYNQGWLNCSKIQFGMAEMKKSSMVSFELRC